MKLLVLGAAVSGSAAARLGRADGHAVEVYDRNPVTLRPLIELGFPVHSGEWAPHLLDDVDTVVASPGIPEHAPPITDALANGIPLWSELEYAARHLDAPYVAVTGTNGKTTTTEAAAAMLVASGLSALAAGNIGTALSDIAGTSWDAVVIEASSFQLRFIEHFHPRAAAVLNIAPDHLDWHGDFDAYVAAKARIAENHTAGDLLVFDGDDPGAVAAVGHRRHAVPVSGSQRLAGGGPEGESLWIGSHRFARPQLDPAFLVDLVVAGHLALHVGATVEGVEQAIAAFRPGSHRRTIVGEWDGVRWVDDSKATNPHSALAAAAAYPSVVLIAGGRNKGLDLSELVTASTVKHTVAIGEAAAELVAVDRTRVTVAGSMEEAIATADGHAVAGDTVLLAPGCASFDMFDSYAARGDAFAAAVLSRKESR